MQAELLFSNETYKLCIFVNFSNKKKAVIGQNDLNISSRVLRRAHALLRSLGARNSWAILWRENLFLVHNWWIFQALENFWQHWLQLDPLNTALLLLKKVSCTFTKQKKPQRPRQGPG